MIKLFILSSLSIWFFASPIYADAASNKEYTFVCNFEHGSSKKFVGTNLFSTSKSKIGNVVFDKVNFTSKTGRVVSNLGDMGVSIVAWEGADGLVKLHFLEKSEEFDVVFTTILVNKNDMNGKFPAAHSSHALLPGNNFEPSNYIGYCNLN